MQTSLYNLAELLKFYFNFGEDYCLWAIIPNWIMKDLTLHFKVSSENNMAGYCIYSAWTEEVSKDFTVFRKEKGNIFNICKLIMVLLMYRFHEATFC